MALRRHLRILTGGTKSSQDTQDEEQNMTPSIKAAFATSDRHKIDQHFGTANAVLIYAVTAEQASVVEFAQFGDLDQDGAQPAARVDARRCRTVEGNFPTEPQITRQRR